MEDRIARAMAMDAAEGGSVDAYTRAETDALLDVKVDAVQGKGLSENDYTDAEKAKLAGAAPQATTYTKGQVDAALAAKLNAADVDDALSSTSTNPVQNRAVQAPIARLVDAGLKNVFPYSDLTGITTNFQDKPLVLPKGAYKLIFHESATSGTFAVRIKDASDNSIFYVTESNANTNHAYDVELSVDSATITIYSSVSNDFTNIMICTVEDYAISSKIVPHAKSNYELTQAVEPIPRLVNAGAKNLINVGDKSLSVSGYLVENLPISIPKNDYCLTVNSSNNVQVLVVLKKSGQEVSRNTSNYMSGKITISISPLTDADTISVWINLGGDVSSVDLTNIMLCTAEDHAISPEFVPYAPSNRELYEMILALQNAQNGG